jgi:D-alanyl-D-alanine carboxypeptidase
MRRHPARGRLVALATVALVAAAVGPAAAWHYSKQGWRDRHRNYPPRPNGYNQIVNTFGQPCNDNANRNAMQWRAADNGVWYTVRFHRKLGGDASTNLNNDVYGHIQNQHLAPYVKHGIYGYSCRKIDGTNSWSTHAWGIAVDVSSAEEWYGKCHSTVNYHHDQVWRNHGWTWGLSFCDPMHFQYATGY